MGIVWYDVRLNKSSKEIMISRSNIQNFFRRIGKFGLYIPLSNLILVYGRKYLPARMLSSISSKRNHKIQKRIIEIVGEDGFNNIPSNASFPTSGSSKIWFCWMQGEENMPEIPRLCLASLRKHANGHEVVVLNAGNYRKYVSLPDHIIQLYESGKLIQAHFADILRVNLLAQQGGLWMDATLFVIKDIPEAIFDAPFFSIKTVESGYFVSHCRWAVFCLAGQKNCLLFQKVAQLFNAYLSHTNLFIDYFMFDQFIDIIYQHNTEIKRMIDNVPINNSHTHDLFPILSQQFDSAIFQDLIQDTYFFKLNWKHCSLSDLLRNKDSYYYFLKNQIS